MRKSIMAAALAGILVSSPGVGQTKYAQGVSDTEIKIGQTVPYSGPASAFAIIGKMHAAYFKMVNDNGGINGRKVSLISLDDAFSPLKTVEATRRLVEQDNVWFTFGSIGTAAQSAVQKYLAGKRVPQLFLSGASKWNSPSEFPLSMPIAALYTTEGEIYGKYILSAFPVAKVGVLYQNDDFGKDFVAGLKKGLGARAQAMVVKEAPFELAEPTLD